MCIIYKKITRAYPGKARNIGASISNGRIIGFVDSKTVPEHNWLEKSLEKMNKDNLDVVFGKTQYVSLNKYQELRSAHLEKRFDDIEYCKNCDFLVDDPEVLVYNSNEDVELHHMIGTSVSLDEYR